MRDVDEILKDARDEMPFANGTEGYGWMEANCDRCIHDYEDACPLLLAAFLNKTPAEWLDGPRDERGNYNIADQYHCIEFRDEDDGPGPEPQPIPDPPGQGLLLERAGYEGPLMFSANVPKTVSHDLRAQAGAGASAFVEEALSERSPSRLVFKPCVQSHGTKFK